MNLHRTNFRNTIFTLLIFGLTISNRFLFITSLLGGSLFSVTSDAGNLFQNSEFEKSADNDVSNWKEVTHGTKGGSLKVINDNLVAHSGNMCLKLEAAPKGLIGVMQGSKIWPGKKYVVRVFARSNNKSKLVISLHLYKRIGYSIRALKLPKDYQRRFIFDTSEKWKEYKVEFTAPENAHSLNVSIYTVDKGPLYVDDASLMTFHPATVRFLPSKEKLVVQIDASFINTEGTESHDIKAVVNVFKKNDKKKPVISYTMSDFKDFKSVWRCSTKDLPEGDYTVNIEVKDGQGKVVARDHDWFKKKRFTWMDNKPWKSDKVPEPYTPLKVENKTISPWGRTYAFDDSGLLKSVISQKRELLAAPMSFSAKIDGKDTEVVCKEPFSIVNQKPGEISAKSELTAGKLDISMEIRTEYDGFVLYKMTYKPAGDSVKINRLRLKVPIKYEHAFLYSAGTDRRGKNILADVFPDKQGKLYDSFNDTRCAYCSPNFCTLFWVAGYHTCFCYAADSDAGWILRDDAPAVEAHREGDQVILWLNLVDQEYELKESRTLEFAFQAGPLKPLPEGWRGFQDNGNPDDAPLTVYQARYSGGGVTCGGGTNFICPGATKEVRDKWIKIREEEIAGGNKAIVGYIFYGTVPKGVEEAEVFRSEWGIDRDTWDSVKEFQTSGKNWMWRNRFFGDDKERYLMMSVTPVPSYIDCITYGYNEVLKYLPISGFYDDVGFPRQVYDEELGQGSKDIHGRKIYSSGQWLYRKRWKQAAFVNWLNGKPNFLRDSQHVRAHFMPAYGFIGLWAPCEHGYYNRFEDKDILEFYGSLKHYLAHNPAYQFGQVPMIGLSTRKWDETGTDKDTRCIMMVTMLHDHDVGSFGKRNLRTVCRLRHARNIFKQWEKDVKFIGYWENGELVKTNSDDIKISMYTRPGSTLFIIGNTEDKDVQADIQVQWDKLNIDPTNLKIINPETMSEIKPSNAGFSLLVPRHDIRLVLAGDLKNYKLTKTDSGDKLPEPEKKLTEYCDSFIGPELSEKWEKGLHKGKSSTGFVNNKLYVQGDHYGHAHIRRKLDIDADTLSVQCMIMRKPTGASDAFGGGLILYWEDGSFIQATPGSCKKKFFYSISGMGSHTGSDINSKSPPDWYPYLVNWVKIKLTKDKIELYCSTDGKTWKKDLEKPRKGKFKISRDSNVYIVLGNGRPGEKPFFANPLKKHFKPENKNPTSTFYSDLIVGTEE